ncbi:hypothetical protein M413DRAFT_382835 [Hebeloma cylindrosporum]|uniref:Uncharacterized protein n=1 Tax=Hebeloma cylindrosporum TaxID=76867 RepID=A0A0C3C3Q2_HEBCY|nr:hypothetical protein M413DRAFT_382835 [Hebeloma cylindrosporum h7]
MPWSTGKLVGPTMDEGLVPNLRENSSTRTLPACYTSPARNPLHINRSPESPRRTFYDQNTFNAESRYAPRPSRIIQKQGSLCRLHLSSSKNVTFIHIHRRTLFYEMCISFSL